MLISFLSKRNIILFAHIGQKPSDNRYDLLMRTIVPSKSVQTITEDDLIFTFSQSVVRTGQSFAAGIVGEAIFHDFLLHYKVKVHTAHGTHTRIRGRIRWD